MVLTEGPTGVDPNDGGGLDGAALFDEVDQFVGQFLIYPDEHARHAHTVWIAHTHLMQVWDSTPRLYFKSPEPGSGKTRAFEVTEFLVPRGIIALNMSPAALIRLIGSNVDNRPTLLVDEIDTVFGPKAKEHEDLRGVIDAGHRRSGKSYRCVAQGSNVSVVEFPAYCAVGLAGLHDLPDTIMSRCVVISMKKRKHGSEKITSWRARECEPRAKALGERLAQWAAEVVQKLWDGEKYAVSWPEMPEGLEDRPADCWEPLLACADFAGGKWPVSIRNAALAALAADREDGAAGSEGVQLLADIRVAFKSRVGKKLMTENTKPALKTHQLIQRLESYDESPWGSYHRDGSRIRPKDLAALLKRYDITSSNIWWSKDSNSRGYYMADFEDAWQRYLVDKEPDSHERGEEINGRELPDLTSLRSPTVEF